ncbi:hypothetical protein P279_16930 [Rhodobacteraceae bacterium PD-2]|nr:hypothetical protein P279_16930 [Rhodobacteraceae bacterium PD-2]
MQIDVLTQPTPAFEALVETHTAFCDSTAPAESCHRLPVLRLFTPEITVWVAQEGGALIGMGALKVLSPTEGEVKSMHTRAEVRGRGAARAILRTILTAARAKGLPRLSLETGTHPAFAPAVALYRAEGFTETGPFGGYVIDPHSMFLTLDLTTAKEPA